MPTLERSNVKPGISSLGNHHDGQKEIGSDPYTTDDSPNDDSQSNKTDGKNEDEANDESISLDPEKGSGRQVICIFDYDLTLSSHSCPTTQNIPEYHCKTNQNPTYGWFDQCLGVAAQAAVKRCIEQGAAIGIASHSPLEASYEDKVRPIKDQFPDWATASSIPDPTDSTQWNCETCPYQMMRGNKVQHISRIMKHYGLNPSVMEDRKQVIFWDDSSTNINDINSGLNGVHAIPVARLENEPEVSGCGINQAAIDRGWQEYQNAR